MEGAVSKSEAPVRTRRLVRSNAIKRTPCGNWGDARLLVCSSEAPARVGGRGRTLFMQMEEYLPRLAEFGNFLWRARADAVRLLADRRFGLRK